MLLGAWLGLSDGVFVPADDGRMLGAWLGTIDGASVGATLGLPVPW